MAIATDSTRWYRGPAQVTFNSIDLGDMKEGSMVEVNITEGRAEHKADQFGSTPVREYGIGHGIEVTVELMEWDFAALSAALFGTSYRLARRNSPTRRDSKTLPRPPRNW